MLAGAAMVTLTWISLWIFETGVGTRDLWLLPELRLFRHVYYYNNSWRRNPMTQEQNSLRELHLGLALTRSILLGTK